MTPGSESSFATFFDEHYPRVFACLCVALRDPVAAAAAAERAFTRLDARWSPVGREDRPATGLFVAASRAALRRPNTTAGARPPASEPGTLERTIEELPTRERLALLLHHYAHLSTGELGRALRCSPATASSTLREAHRRAGIEIEDDDDIPEVDFDVT